MKNHYLMTQIADMVKQLYEWFYLKKKGIKKKQKNISSDLLISLGGHQQPENIYEEPNESALNQEKYSKRSDAWQEGKTKKSTKYNSVG